MTEATPRPCPLCGFVNPSLRTGWAMEPAYYVRPDPKAVRAVNAHDGLVRALELIMPLAKGYSPSGQTDTAKATCRKWIAAAEEALALAKRDAP